MRYVGVGNPDGTLKHARKEVLTASKYFAPRKSFVVLDKVVDADELLKRLNAADVIHFACHAALRADVYELSYLLIGPGKPLRTVDILARGHTRAKLVLLSACSTSLGRVTPSDEITSLARAFLYIGAEAVLATLWPIPDETTSKFIGEFFHQWVTLAKPRREAFNAARHALHAQPRVGLAFVLIEV